ncbi:M13 family metallopeptidase [Nocardioides marmoribigeumensis]|uniref:Endothelin-converting enzyme/putative endopeptidase n=1 Tax=Nocardioides marmoribigeumensis TaxID=433649 RepID=A0ABU2BV02_9ACTN|nr:M13-type metalloendopeptidase [Nocardioides marmoribigeumensis]MDR7362455.1 endothelin-converting enzyme/putative endopeptidase [Nocardioides marmoribigeumensis]
MTILDDARPGMDPDVRPQDDLFGHVNGRWLAETEIPSDRASWGAFHMLAEAAESHVRALLEEADAEADQAPPGSTTQQIGHLYRSFLDEARVEELGASPVAAALAEIAAVTDHPSLAAHVGRAERTGVGGFFGAYVSTDDRNSERYLVQLVQGGLGLPDESYYREEKFASIREAYTGYLSALFALAGDLYAEDPDVSAARVLRLETRLAEGHWERAATRDVIKCYNLMTFEQLRELAPAFAWEEYAEALGATEETLAEVVVRQPSYLAHLSGVVADQSVELADWQAWMSARTLRSAAPYLSSAFVERNFDFYGRTLSGTPELRARWKRAVTFVEGSVGEAVGERYVERHFPPAAKAAMDELVTNLLEAYRRSITDLDWMTEATKARAFDKLRTFRPKIGYPEKFRDYSALRVEPGDLWGNAQRAAEFEHDRQLGKIGSPVDRDEWHMLPQTVNAYYNPGINEICFPAAILQRPFFDLDADPAENYGGIGAVIGHEIGHGFDDQGSEYDELGNLNEWWTEADKAAFRERADKLIAQYDGLSPRALPEEKVNGALTVGENIGDLGGLTIGLKAYLISLGDRPLPESDGLTGTQRLFLNWAHVWRTKDRTELALQRLTVDPHSPPEFRANIARNLDEFHSAFATRPGDGLWLEPEERVRIW